MKYDVFMGIHVVRTFSCEIEAGRWVETLRDRYLGTRLGIYYLARR
jgi:hypothetical protein